MYTDQAITKYKRDDDAFKRSAMDHWMLSCGLLHHFDRGGQYASQDYRQRLAQAGCIAGMSRPDNSYDNAARESFRSGHKRELGHRCQFATRAEAKAAIFE